MIFDNGPLDVMPIVDVLSRILEELQELNQAVRELPSQIATEITSRQ